MSSACLQGKLYLQWHLCKSIFFQWMRYSSDWLRFNNSVINTRERTEFRPCSLSLQNPNRKCSKGNMRHQNEVTPIQKPTVYIIQFCITQNKSITHKYSSALFQDTRLPCREEESQKHEAHLNRKYWKRNKLKLDLHCSSKCPLNPHQCCAPAFCTYTRDQKPGWTKSIQRNPMTDNP